MPSLPPIYHLSLTEEKILSENNFGWKSFDSKGKAYFKEEVFLWSISLCLTGPNYHVFLVLHRLLLNWLYCFRSWKVLIRPSCLLANEFFAWKWLAISNTKHNFFWERHAVYVKMNCFFKFQIYPSTFYFLWKAEGPYMRNWLSNTMNSCSHDWRPLRICLDIKSETGTSSCIWN